jgi:hypothetical protein
VWQITKETKSKTGAQGLTPENEMPKERPVHCGIIRALVKSFVPPATFPGCQRLLFPLVMRRRPQVRSFPAVSGAGRPRKQTNRRHSQNTQNVNNRKNTTSTTTTKTTDKRTEHVHYDWGVGSNASQTQGLAAAQPCPLLTHVLYEAQEASVRKPKG